MKNFTNNFKQFTSRLSARWLIMALMMLVGTSSAWANKAIYLDPGVWNTDNPTYDVWAWKSGASGVRYQSTKVGSYYQASVPDDVTHVIWFRRSAAVSGTGWSDDFWNRSSGDASGFTSGSTGNNLLTITGWGSNKNSTWSTSYYDDISTYTVSGTSSTVKLSDSDKWVTYTLYKDGAAVSNSGKTGTGSELSWTVTTSGIYTIKGTNTYKTEDMTGSYSYSSCTTCCTNYYVAGESSLCGEGWDPGADLMDCLNDEWSITFNDREADTYTFKITDGTWNNSWNSFDNTKGNVTCKDDGSNDHNIQFTTTSKGDITISFDGSKAWVTFEESCPTPEQPNLSEGKAILDNCGNVVNGSILINNYANYGAGYTFKLDGNNVTPANDGTISVSTAKEYTVTVTNECGTSNDASVTITKTTIVAPRTDYQVSISYPQVAYADNNGSIYIDLSGSERDVKYYLYKDGSKVVDPEKQGDGKGLRWDGIVETGTYTVKAYNPCSQGEIEIGSVEFACMSNLELAFEGGKSTFCPGETANVIVTFTGTGKGDEDTNGGKFGWKWEGSNYTYQSVYLTESGITMPVTINANGSIQLNVKTCNDILSSTPLNFTVVTAPEKPLLDSYAKEICTGETAEITISPYDNAYTYKLYKGVNEVETPEFNAGVFTVSEAGSYTVTAVEAECSLESVSSDPSFTLSARGTTITPSVAEIHPYEVVTFTAGEQAKWALYTNPSSGSQLSDDDAKYSGKDTAYITKGESTTTKFKGEAANGYVIHATVGDCTASYTFNVVEDPDNCQ